MTKKDLLLVSIYNKCDRAECEFDEYLQRVRYSNPDEVELLEHIIRKVRRDTLREVLGDIMKILSLTNPK